MSDYQRALDEFYETAEVHGGQFAEEIFMNFPQTYADKDIAKMFSDAERDLAEKSMEVFAKYWRDGGFNDESILTSAKQRGLAAFYAKLVRLRSNHVQEGSA